MNSVPLAVATPGAMGVGAMRDPADADGLHQIAIGSVYWTMVPLLCPIGVSRLVRGQSWTRRSTAAHPQPARLYRVSMMYSWLWI